MKQRLFITAITLLFGFQSAMAQNNLSNTSGFWYDPAYDGSGFNMAELSGGLYIYFYGYKNNTIGDDTGEAQWLVTAAGIPTPIIVDQTYEVDLRSGFIGNGGSFTTAPTTENSGTEVWGLLSLTFDSCESGIATLTGNDGQVSHEIVKFAEINGLSCQINSNETAVSTENVLCSYSQTTSNNQSSLTLTSTSTWACSDGTRLLTANGIPNHEVGEFPNEGNPNTIGEVDVAASFSLMPVETSTATQLGGPRGVTGYVLNGVKIDAGTAGSCDDSGSSCSLIDNSGNWSIEALGQSSFNFGTDNNNAHVQPTGDYHYHGMPENYLSEQGADNTQMTLIGWAADGFPIYARYGYSIPNDASSEIVAVTGSYQLIDDVSTSRPSVSTYPLGTFQQDWEYIEGSGDLDECNGRVGVTPEFPEGIYHYFATDSYPYFQRCVKGEVDIDETLPPPPQF